MLIVIVSACKQQPCTVIPPWRPYDESEELTANAKHPSQKMQYKLIQLKLMDKNEIWKNISNQLCNFTEEKYQTLKPFILEQDIPTLQSHIKSGIILGKTNLSEWANYLCQDCPNGLQGKR